MKKIILLPIIIGSALLIAGSIVFAVAVAKSLEPASYNNKTVALDEDFTNFDIELSTSNLEFKVSEDTSKKVVLSQTDKVYHTVKVSDGTLHIKQVDDRKWYEKMFDFTLSKMKASIYLPAENYNNLKIDSSTGDITIPHDFSFTDANIELSTGHTSFKANVTNTLKIKASTGEMKVDSVETKNIDLEVSTGNVYLDNINVEESINIKTSTGDVRTNAVRAKNLDIKCSTGKMYLKDTVASETIKLKASTGDIKLDRVDALYAASDKDAINIETGTGDVKGTILTSKIFVVDTDTGKKNYPSRSTTGGICSITTDTGDIDIQIAE